MGHVRNGVIWWAHNLTCEPLVWARRGYPPEFGIVPPRTRSSDEPRLSLHYACRTPGKLRNSSKPLPTPREQRWCRGGHLGACCAFAPQYSNTCSKNFAHQSHSLLTPLALTPLGSIIPHPTPLGGKNAMFRGSFNRLDELPIQGYPFLAGWMT